MRDYGLGYHIRTHLKDNRVIASTPRQRRIAIRTVLCVGRRHGLLCAKLPDTHLHAENQCDNASAAAFERRVGGALRQQLGTSMQFVAYERKPIRDPSHLLWSFRYTLTQDDRHELDWDPFHEASSLPDLLGARLVGEYTAINVSRALPRVKLEDLYAWLEIKPLVPIATPRPELLEEIEAATLRAACLLELGRRSAAHLAARRAALAVIGRALSRAEAARRLGVSQATLYRDLQGRVDPKLERAIRLQLDWSARVRAEQARRSARAGLGERKRSHNAGH